VGLLCHVTGGEGGRVVAAVEKENRQEAARQGQGSVLISFGPQFQPRRYGY
jgi:hypothetical protein